MDRRTFLTSTVAGAAAGTVVTGTVTGVVAGPMAAAPAQPAARPEAGATPGTTRLRARIVPAAFGNTVDHGPLADAAWRFAQALAERTAGAVTVAFEFDAASGTTADIVFAGGDHGADRTPSLSLFGAAPLARSISVRAAADRLSTPSIRRFWSERSAMVPLAIGLIPGKAQLIAPERADHGSAQFRAFGLVARALATIGRGDAVEGSPAALAGIAESGAVQILPADGRFVARPLSNPVSGPVLAAFVDSGVWVGLTRLERAVIESTAATELAQSAAEQDHIASTVLPGLVSTGRWHLSHGAAPSWANDLAVAMSDLTADLVRLDPKARMVLDGLSGPSPRGLDIVPIA